MATATAKHWITGEEYAAERRRLVDAGEDATDTDWESLDRRVDERNEHIFERFADPLIARHPGQWGAISVEGDAVISDSELGAIRAGRERFGASNFCLTRLDRSRRGRTLLTPRTG